MMTETKLVAAAVYRNGCIMKRNGSVKLEAGTQKVYFGGLSANVDESSLRLSVPDNLSGGNVQLEYPTREQQTEALKELNTQLSALKKTAFFFCQIQKYKIRLCKASVFFIPIHYTYRLFFHSQAFLVPLCENFVALHFLRIRHNSGSLHSGKNLLIQIFLQCHPFSVR